MKKYILLLTVFSHFLSYAGGGWTQSKGEGFFLLSQRMIAGTNYFNSDRAIISSPSLAAFTTNFYGEYGITDKLTGIIYSPFLTVLSRDGGIDELGNLFIADNALGFGDLDVSIKYGILTKNFKLAATLTLGVPSGNFNAGTTGSLHLGDGEFNQMLRFDGSMGLKKGFFATVFAGFNNRNSGFSDEIHYGGELGWTKNKFTGILKIYGRNSLFNELRKDSPIPGIYSDNLEYFSVSPQILYKLKGNFGVLAEAGFATASRNIIAAPSLTIGFYYELKQK